MHTLNLFMWYLLIVNVAVFIFNGLFQIFFDCYYWIYYVINKIRAYHTPPTSYYDFTLIPEKKIALMLPCWHEEDVVGEMLTHNLHYINYQNYDVFVGIYPNDLATKKVLQDLQKTHSNIYYIETPFDGPSTKADNLNSLFHGIFQHEIVHQTRYDIFLMHDAEDIIHPFALKLYNYHIPQKPIVQTPVLPLRLPLKEWTHWTYCDEFADLHTKELVVRSNLKGFVPSAGVGTAFSRHSLLTLAQKHNNQPFNKNALTEDYDVSLQLHLLNINESFSTYTFPKLSFRKKWWLFGKRIPIRGKTIISTYALFPNNYHNAVKQRSRWIHGITMQEWRERGWPGNLVTKLLLFHDRKFIITFHTSITGYIVIIYWIIIYCLSLLDTRIETLGDYLAKNMLIYVGIIICTAFTIEYLIQRFISTMRVYGFVAALLTPFRAIYGNIINVHATIRAYIKCFSNKKIDKPTQPTWIKTKNRFPSPSQLAEYKINLNDLLLERRLVTIDTIKKEIQNEDVDCHKVVAMLLKYDILTFDHLIQALSVLSQIPSFAFKKSVILPLRKTPKITRSNHKWLIEHDFYPIKVTKENLILAVDPAQSNNQQLQEEASKVVLPYKAKFILNAKVKSKWQARSRSKKSQ